MNRIEYNLLHKNITNKYFDDPILLGSILKVIDKSVFAPEPEYRFKNLQEVWDIVCEISEIDSDSLKGDSRFRVLVNARYFFFYIVKDVFGRRYPLKEIGKFAGFKDHTTVIHGIEVVKNMIDTKDPLYVRLFEKWDERTSLSVIA